MRPLPQSPRGSAGSLTLPARLPHGLAWGGGEEGGSGWALPSLRTQLLGPLHPLLPPPQPTPQPPAQSPGLSCQGPPLPWPGGNTRRWVEDPALSRSSIKSSWCLHFTFLNSWLASLLVTGPGIYGWAVSRGDKGEGSLEAEAGPRGFFAEADWLVQWRWEEKPSPQRMRTHWDCHGHRPLAADASRLGVFTVWLKPRWWKSPGEDPGLPCGLNQCGHQRALGSKGWTLCTGALRVWDRCRREPGASGI